MTAVQRPPSIAAMKLVDQWFAEIKRLEGGVNPNGVQTLCYVANRAAELQVELDSLQLRVRQLEQRQETMIAGQPTFLLPLAPEGG